MTSSFSQCEAFNKNDQGRAEIEYLHLTFLFSSSDRDLTYACVGIIVNMMSDPEQRPQFREQVMKLFGEYFEYQYSNYLYTCSLQFVI